MTGTHIDGPGIPVIRRSDYAQPRHKTYSGIWINPIDPDPASIYLQDIAYALSNQARYYGMHGPYTVAQHAVRVALRVPDDKRAAALMHDSPEAYLGDMSHVLKYATEVLGPEYRRIEAHVARKIEQAFGFEPFAFDDPEIKAADDEEFAVEWDAVVEGNSSLEVWSHADSELAFHALADELLLSET